VSSRSLRGRFGGRTGLLLIPAAALVVHQLRYTLTYGSKANAELTAQGHSYLHSLAPWAVLVLAIGLSAFVRRLAQVLRTGSAGTFSRQSAAGLWALTTAGLVLVYTVQESLEELFASGHPTGLAGVFGHGGWWALPTAGAVSVLVVALLRLGRSILVAAGRFAVRRARLAPVRLSPPSPVALVAASPLALSAAGRAPPRLLRAG
jgi:hypothetical protein